MTKGLVTRFGEWLDRKFLANAKEIEIDQLRAELHQRWNDLENSQITDKLRLEKMISDARVEVADLKISVNQISVTETVPLKEFEDLKTRIERLELYSGMTRKVDPTKPAVAKSAFSM